MPSIYKPTLSIHFFSKNTIGVDTWRNYADTWLGVYTWRGVDTWPVTTEAYNKIVLYYFPGDYFIEELL